MSHERLSMRKIEEILRLKYEVGLTHRAIAQSCWVSPSTVSEYVTHAKAAGLRWPLPEGINNEQLNELLFPQGIVNLMGTCTLLGHNLKMKAQKEIPTYKRHRYPIEIIRHCVWLYFRFSLSYRDVELLMTERGITVSYESIRQWCLKFGDEYALKLRKRRGQPGDKWHLDEIFIKINGKTHYLWRAVDQNGMVLDILVTRRRNKEAAKRFFLKLLRGLKYEPRVIITDKLRSYGAAIREVLPHVEHRQHKGLNNRAENSHRPTRRRERVMQRFKSLEQAQRFLSPFGPIYEHFKPRRHLMKATDYRQIMGKRFQVWQDVTAVTSC